MLPHLKELNPYVTVEAQSLDKLEDCLNGNIIDEIDLVIVTKFYPLDFLYQLNDLLRKKGKSLIVAASAGLLGFVFTDFGDEHVIFDKNGEPLKHGLVTGITDEGIIYTEDRKRHHLEEGELVKFKEVIGVDGINEKVFEVKKISSPFTFQIDTSGI